MPLIYSMLQAHFNIEDYRDNGLDYSHKVFVMLEKDLIFTLNGYELPTPPKNAKKTLVKRLEKYKKYNKHYTVGADKNYWNNNRTVLGDDIEIAQHLDFNHWDVRDAFFEFNQWLMQDYQSFLLSGNGDASPGLGSLHKNRACTPANIFEDVDLMNCQADNLFNIEGWLKKRAKGKEYFGFLESFTKTNIFTKYIEMRVFTNSFEEKTGSNFMKRQEFFDQSYTVKRTKK
jgi:hypothetical protein